MPRKCTVCAHPDRAEIDGLLVGKRARSLIAEAYQVTEWALKRHEESHLVKELVEAAQRLDLEADSLLQEIVLLRRKTLEILNDAISRGDNRTALAAIKEARGNVELLAKLRGDIGDGTATVEVVLGWDNPATG